MDDTVRENPLQEYIGKGSTADVQVKAHGKTIVAAGVLDGTYDEGAEFDSISEDELSE
jgi:hypothetical protein